MQNHKFPQGMTVKELKALVKDWPEEDENGEPTDVFIETGRGLSSAVTEVWMMNARVSEDEKNKWSDMLLVSQAFVD